MQEKDRNSHGFWESRYLAGEVTGSDVNAEGPWKLRKLDVLSQICRRHQIRRVLDLGCGDLQVLADWPELGRVDYVGVDFSETVVNLNKSKFPHLKFILADLSKIQTLRLEPPDLVICFDLLVYLQEDQTYDRLCEFIFNCGARAVALTCTVGGESKDGLHLRYRDFWKHAHRLQLGYIRKVERSFRQPFERIISFDLCETYPAHDPTEIVYVCSPDRARQLFISLGTLFRSGSLFDRVIIFCIGHRPPTWKISDPRIIVKQVTPQFGTYFHGNKIYVCTRAASRVVFLDADTLILRPLDLVWQGQDADILARVGKAYENPCWNQRIWEETFDSVNSRVVPMYNAGFLVFQNQAQVRIHGYWKEFIQNYLSQQWRAPWKDSRMYEQWALALAVGKARLRHSELGARHHAYGWVNEPAEEAVVFHTGSNNFARYVWEFKGNVAPLDGGGWRGSLPSLQEFEFGVKNALKMRVYEPALAFYRKLRNGRLRRDRES